MLRCFQTIACLVLVTQLSAQRFGATPPEVKWKQINTDTARIIFSQGLDSQAQRVAELVHLQARHNVATLGDRLKKINIVLQNQTVIGNGYVGLGPYRSEFYMTPTVNNFDQGSVGWVDALAIHEYRHVQQFNNFRNGISKLMKILFGEEGYALAINASIPDWFYEGDAVYSETVLSQQGRGRLPLFMNAYPSLWTAGKNYSWMKLRNGSWKDYVPGHYQLGYLFVNYGYEKYGLDFWRKVTKDASAFKGLFYPFQSAIKRQTGVDYQTFKKDAFKYYKTKTADDKKNVESIYTTIFPVNKKYVTNYVFPYQLPGDSLLCLRTSYRHRPGFYVKDKSGVHRLRIRDISIDDQFSYRNGKIVYAAFENDPRWTWRDYSVIKLLDVQTGNQTTVTRKSKYFTPDISPSGQKIVAVEIADNGKSELHVLDAVSGELKTQIDLSEVNLFTDPRFLNEDSIVTAIRLNDGRMTLALIELINGKSTVLIPASFNVTGFPSISNNVVYFTASFGGYDNVFAVRLDDGKIYRITDGPSGKYFVNAANGKITWSVFSAEGYQLQQIDEPTTLNAALANAVAEELTNVYPVSHTNEIREILSANTFSQKRPVSPYHKGTRLLNFHSFRPYYEDPEFSFSLYGENVLNTMQTEVYYVYNENENTNAVGFSAVYGAWFPYINGGTQYTFNRTAVVDSSLKQWDQLDTRIGLSIPLSFTSGRSFKNVSFGSNYVFRNDIIKGEAKNHFSNSNFSYLSHFIRYSQQVQSAVQHIFPRLGLALSGQFNHAITKYESWQFLGNASLYLPGVASTHSLVLTGAWQERDTLDVLFSNRFSYSRGYNEAYFSRMWRTSANYHFPLFYTDWGFANILYLQRIRANAFYDFTKVYSNDKSRSADQRSVGGELYVDTKWWNQYELSFGIRVSQLLDTDFFTRTKGTIVEFIMPVSIFPK